MSALPTPATQPSADSTAADAFRRRAIFLDFDGTTADHGVIGAANVEAIRRVREAGHVVVLSTGRPECIVADEVSALVDGLICSAGASVRLGDTRLSDLTVPTDLAERMLAVLEEVDATIVLEAADGIYCTPETGRAFAATVGTGRRADREPGSVGQGDAEILAAVRTPDDLHGVRFAKVLVRSASLGLTEIAERIGSGIRALPSSIQDDSSSSGELQMADVDKADGVARVAEHLGIPLADTIGVGDGANDVGMLALTGTSIAIAGSRPEVLARADFEVPGPGDGGLAVAFSRLGLI